MMDSICKLCQQPAALQDSHIIPEFCYDPIYDNKHRFKIVGNVPSTRRSNLQKGLREYLLCRPCEQKIGKWETYVSRIFHGIDQIPGSRNGDTIALEGLLYPPMKLFLLSLLWRTGVSTLPVFQHTELGEHESILRKMLAEEDPGIPESYGCLIYSVTLNGNRLQALYGPPPCYIDPAQVYRMLVGGFLLLYFVSTERPRAEFTSKFLNAGGSLVLEEKEIDQIPFLNALAVEIAKAKTDHLV
jgi:hypothetical protein